MPKLRGRGVSVSGFLRVPESVLTDWGLLLSYPHGEDGSVQIPRSGAGGRRTMEMVQGWEGEGGATDSRSVRRVRISSRTVRTWVGSGLVETLDVLVKLVSGISWLLVGSVDPVLCRFRALLGSSSCDFRFSFWDFRRDSMGARRSSSLFSKEKTFSSTSFARSSASSTLSRISSRTDPKVSTVSRRSWCDCEDSWSFSVYLISFDSFSLISVNSADREGTIVEVEPCVIFSRIDAPRFVPRSRRTESEIRREYR